MRVFVADYKKMGCCESSATNVALQPTEAEGWDVMNGPKGMKGMGSFGLRGHLAVCRGCAVKGVGAGCTGTSSSARPDVAIKEESLRGAAQQAQATPPQTSSEPRPSTSLVAWPQRAPVLKTELARLQYRDVTPEDYELLCLLDDEVPKKGRRTPEAFLASMARCRAGDCGASECQVCLMAIDADTQVIRLPCQHVAYHPDCISEWLTRYSGVCPLCQAAVEPPLAPPGDVACRAPAAGEARGLEAASSGRSEVCHSTV